MKKIIFLLALFVLLVVYWRVSNAQHLRGGVTPPPAALDAQRLRAGVAYLGGEKEPEPVLSFAVVSDPESDLDNLQKAITKVKEMGLEFIIIPGDLTQTGTPKELEQIKQTLQQLQHFLIPGNHDIWYSRKQGKDIYTQYFGPRYYSKEIKGFQFIFLDNSDEWQKMSKTQLDWLEVKLLNLPVRQAGLKPLNFFIFSHIPFFHSESNKAMGEYSQDLKDQASQLLEKFCQNPPLAIISGHLHKAEDYEYSCKNGNKIRMINAGSVNESRNWQLPRFLKIDLFEDGGLEIEEIELEN